MSGIPVGPAVALLVVLVPLALAVLTWNRIVARRNGIRAAWSTIDVQLQRRHDLVPQLVSAVAGYQSHERATLEAVTRALPAATAAGLDVPTRAGAENGLTGALRPLVIDIERTPDLRAGGNALRLQEDLLSTENRIARSRQHYNDLVLMFNDYRQVVPRNLVAALFGVRPEPYLDLELTGDPRPAPAGPSR